LRRLLQAGEGVYRTRLALALWQMGGERVGPSARARAALADLLDLAEGKQAILSAFDASKFWASPHPGLNGQEMGALGDAIAGVYQGLEAGGDPLPILGRFLRDRRTHVRLAAAVALARVEPTHPDLVPALRRLLERQPHFFCY